MNPFDKYTSLVPYMIRAYYEWMIDNDLTPFIHVDTSVEGVSVPSGSIDENGNIILNIGVNATGDLHISDTEISFKSRFQGTIHEIVVPLDAINCMWERNGEIQFMMREPEAMQDPKVEQEELDADANHQSELQVPEVEQVEEVKPEAEKSAEPTIRVI